MAKNNSRSRNNNPAGRNQYSNDWVDAVKERPMAAAATAAAAVGAGVFLWSKRTQISEQISNLSDQISDWKDSMRSPGSEDEYEMADTGGSSTSGAVAGASRTSRSTGSRPTSTRSGKSSNRGLSETGGGNASLGAQSGTSGTGSIS